MKFIYILSLLLISTVAFCVIQEPTCRCDPNTFSIMPWDGQMSEGSIVDIDEHFKDMYDMGFNVTGFITADELPKAKKHKLMATLRYKPLINIYAGKMTNPEKEAQKWANELKGKIEKNLKNIYQIYIIDEPFIKDAKTVSAYAKACKEILGVRPYVNFNPNYAPASVFEGIAYKEYLNSFLNICPLDYISYDNYSFFQVKGFDEDRFYSNIEEIRNIANNHNMNFVNTILSVGHYNYADPDDFSIGVQGWSTLAYGGKGLSYFTVRKSMTSGYRYAAYDKVGNKTPVWYAIQRMNYSIHNIMPYYKNLTCINTFHIGNIPKGCKGIESSKNLKNLVITINSHPEGYNPKANVLVGEFTDKNNKEYVIIVNKDPQWSCFVSKIEFNKGKDITLIRDWNLENKEIPFTSSGNKYIIPGQGILLKAE